MVFADLMKVTDALANLPYVAVGDTDLAAIVRREAADGAIRARRRASSTGCSWR